MESVKEESIRNIYYIIPDIHKRELSFIDFLRAIKNNKLSYYIKNRVFRKPKPVGGIKVAYQHCLILNELGFNATPVRLGKYEGNFFHYPIKTVHISEVENTFSENDILVCPEICPKQALKYSVPKKVLFAQNWTQLYERNLFKGEALETSYQDAGFDAVMCCSPYLVQFLNKEPAGSVAVVNNYIDQRKFKENAAIRIKNRVLALPRKNPDDLKKIVNLLKQDNIDFVFADGLTEDQIITEYQKADIFLATGYPEGFGLPPLEAMACGAVVVGFTGGAASEFMIHNETALVAEDGDTETAANLLIELLNKSDFKEKLRVNSLIIAKRYNVDRTKKELKDFYIVHNESKGTIG